MFIRMFDSFIRKKRKILKGGQMFQKGFTYFHVLKFSIVCLHQFTMKYLSAYNLFLF